MKQVDVKADLHALRLASLNQILDPWIYILFRKELFARTFKCFKDVVFIRCQRICQDCSQNERESNGANIDKPRHIPFIKYESDYVHINEENDLPIVQHDDKLNDGNSNGMNMKPVSPRSRASSFKTKGSGALVEETEITDETLLLKTRKPHNCLHLKHSACLFCLSNHPKTFVLSSISESRSMNEINLIDEGARYREIKANTNNGFNYLSKGRRDSIHLSLTDVSLRYDECMTIATSDSSVNC